MRTQITNAAHIKNEEKTQNSKNDKMPAAIPMDKSVFDIGKKKEV